MRLVQGTWASEAASAESETAEEVSPWGGPSQKHDQGVRTNRDWGAANPTAASNKPGDRDPVNQSWKNKGTDRHGSWADGDSRQQRFQNTWDGERQGGQDHTGWDQESRQATLIEEDPWGNKLQSKPRTQASDSWGGRGRETSQPSPNKAPAKKAEGKGVWVNLDDNANRKRSISQKSFLTIHASIH